MVKRTVLYAKLHQTVHLPRLGDFTATLPPTLKNYGMTMVTTEEGIELEAKHPQTGVKHSALIPWGNVAIAELGPVIEEQPSPTTRVNPRSNGK